MKRFTLCLILGYAMLAAHGLFAQQAPSTATVPRLVAFSGTVRESGGQPLRGVIAITFSLYKEQEEGTALWMETQNVTADKAGHYSVQLGASQADGLPMALFSSGEARWLGLRVNGEAEQPRTLLLSVPYALKAGDAETLGGRPVSAFLTAVEPESQEAAGNGVPGPKPKLPPTVHGDGSAAIGFLPLWTAKNLINKSAVFQDASGKLGVGTAVPAAMLDVNGTGNFSGTVSGDAVNAASLYELGGRVFAAGSFSNSNVFLGFAGNLTTTGFENTATGTDALLINTTGQQNTATGTDALFKNTTGGLNTASGVAALALNTTGPENTASGVSALFNNTTGSHNTASGLEALFFNTTGSSNTALGSFAGPDGSHFDLTNSTAVGAFAQVTQSNSLVLGSINGVNGATADTNVGIGTTAPAFKLHVGVGNKGLRVEGPAQGTSSPVLASFGGTGDFDIDAVNTKGGRFIVTNGGRVGIGTASPDNTLSVNGNADKPGGGSWGTFSDGRLKTLHGNYTAGVSELLQLQPVRYRYKPDNALGIRDSEEHVGFVAQDVRAVIPEAVTENSQGYLLVNNDPILWTMLNAIKQQQRQIQAQRAQIRRQQSQIERLSSKVGVLEASAGAPR